MEKNNVLTVALWLLVILGVVMIYLGAFFTPNILYPPIVTGLGFFVIAWVFSSLKS